jgi:hypothetical protein
MLVNWVINAGVKAGALPTARSPVPTLYQVKPEKFVLQTPHVPVETLFGTVPGVAGPVQRKKQSANL